MNVTSAIYGLSDLDVLIPILRLLGRKHFASTASAVSAAARRDRIHEPRPVWPRK